MKLSKVRAADFAVLVWTLLGGAGMANAAENPAIGDKYILFVGGFFSDVGFNGGVDGTLSGDHPEIDFNGRFGLSRSDSLASAEFGWRYTDRWSARLQYFESGRSGTAVLGEDIEFGDVVFEQGSSVSMSSGVDIFRLFFARELSTKEDRSYGVGAGLHRLGFDLTLSGDIVANGQPVIDQSRGVSATAPLPNIGGWYSWAPSQKWVVSGRVDWLAASINDYDGRLLNGSFGVDYLLSKHFGIGAKYQAVRLNLDVDRTDWQGSMELNFEGTYLYLSARWN